MPRTYTVTLTPAERQRLVAFAASDQAPAHKIRRAQILLKADANQSAGGWTDLAISQALDVSLPAIERVRRLFREERLEVILEDQLHSTDVKPPLSQVTPLDAVTVTASTVTASPTVEPRDPASSRHQQWSQSPTKTTSRRRLPRLPARISRFLQQRWLWTGCLPVLVLVFTGATGWKTWDWLVSLPPEPNCQNLMAITATDGDRLYCANQAALQGSVTAISSGLDLVNQMQPGHPLYTQAQDLADRWSKSSLLVAQQQADQGNFKRAIMLLQKVPQSSSAYERSQNSIKIWQRQLEKGKQLLQTARADLKRKEWTQAMIQMRELSNLGGQYWQVRADRLLDEIIIARKVAQKS